MLTHAARATSRAITALLSVPVWLYRRVISPLKPPTCRFRPTCSAYALEALRVHGPLRGSWLIVRRLLRCHPFCEPGFDPVPGRAPEHRDDPTPASKPAASAADRSRH